MNSPSGLLETVGAAEQPRARRRPRFAFVLLSALALSLVAGVTWWTVAGSRINAVDVVALPDGVACTEGEVVPVPRDELTPDQGLSPAVQATPGLACSVGLIVVNNGGSDVRLERLVVPVMGPRGGAGVQIVTVAPFGNVQQEATGDDGGIDAVVQTDTVLAAGEKLLVTLQLSFRDDGCNSPGTTTTPGGPLVHVTALGRTGQRQPALPPFSVAGTAASDCPDS
jgi:hypothetical protein